MHEKEIQHKHADKTVPGDALLFSLVLITISASICISREALQGRVMEALFGTILSIKKEKKMQKKEEPDRSGLEIDICMEKFFLFLLLPLLKVKVCDWNDTPQAYGSGAVGHLTGKPGAGGFLIWSLAWREVYCSMGCCSPGRVNC